MLERDFGREHVGENDDIVMRSAEHPTYRGKAAVTNWSYFNCLLFEVVVRTTDPKDPTLA